MKAIFTEHKTMTMNSTDHGIKSKMKKHNHNMFWSMANKRCQYNPKVLFSLNTGLSKITFLFKYQFIIVG